MFLNRLRSVPSLKVSIRELEPFWRILVIKHTHAVTHTLVKTIPRRSNVIAATSETVLLERNHTRSEQNPLTLTITLTRRSRSTSAFVLVGLSE